MEESDEECTSDIGGICIMELSREGFPTLGNTLISKLSNILYA